MTFRTQFNYRMEEPVNSEKPSETIPGQSSTIRELYHRAMAGQPIFKNNNLRYTGNEYVPNFDKMDPVERDQYIEHIAKLKASIHERNQELDVAQKLELEKKELEQYQKWAEKFRKTEMTPVTATEDNEPT